MMTLEQALMIVTEQNNNRNYQKLNDRIPSRQKVLSYLVWFEWVA